MEAPETIYVHEASAPELTEKLPYHLEYIRKDTFIEKACEFVKSNIDHYIGHYLNDDDTYLDDSFIEDFKKYMEE